MLLTSLCVALLLGAAPLTKQATEFDAETFKTNIKELYLSAKQGFKNSKGAAMADAEDGSKQYECSITLSGALDGVIAVDAEKSQRFIARFEFKNAPLAEQQMEQMINLIVEATAEFGLARNSAVDIRYVKYKKHTVEFPSDNIDVMGKYPSFSLGMIKDSNPVVIELIVNEPFWK